METLILRDVFIQIRYLLEYNSQEARANRAYITNTQTENKEGINDTHYGPRTLCIS